MKNVIITGANEGIGYHMLRQLLEDGNNAAVLDIHIDQLEPLGAQHPGRLLVAQGDVRDADFVRDTALRARDAFGALDYAIHNACLCPFAGFEALRDEEIHDTFAVNYFGAVNLCRAVLPIMKAQKQGNICFTSSGVGVTGYINISPYACSKGAIESLAKCLRNEYADLGITFHIMHPPLTNTKSSSPLPVPKEFKALPEKVGKGFIRHIDSRKFIITPSFADAVSVKLSYLFPLFMGKMLVKMTRKAASN